MPPAASRPRRHSPEKFTLLTDLAAEFNATGFEVDGTCVCDCVPGVVGYRRQPALRRLAGGHRRGTATRAVEPGCPSWGSIVNQRLSEAGQELIANDFERIMLTPLSSACPGRWPRRSGGPRQRSGGGDNSSWLRDPDGWGAFGHPEWGPFRLGKTNPNFSTSGLSATVATFYGATGKTRDSPLTTSVRLG